MSQRSVAQHYHTDTPFCTIRKSHVTWNFTVPVTHSEEIRRCILLFFCTLVALLFLFIWPWHDDAPNKLLQPNSGWRFFFCESTVFVEDWHCSLQKKKKDSAKILRIIVSALHWWGPMGAVRIRHSIREIAAQPVILWILLGGKPKWLPLNFGFNDVMRTAPIGRAWHWSNST